jgi:hypothetical protein
VLLAFTLVRSGYQWLRVDGLAASFFALPPCGDQAIAFELETRRLR